MKTNFKKSLLLLCAVLFCLGSSAQENLTNKYGKLFLPGKYDILSKSFTRADDINEQIEKAFACPEGTVYNSTYVYNGTSTMGNMCADEGRLDMPSVFYQSIEANLYKINGIRFFGIFKTYDEEKGWMFCDEKGAINENGDLTETIKFRISFHKMDKDGFPTEAIYSKEFDILGNNIGLTMGDDKSGYGAIYSFDADFGEDILLETGLIGITAVNTNSNSKCWFNLLITSCAKGTGLVGMFDNTEWMSSFAPAPICLKGSGEMSAKKAIKIERFLSPKVRSNGKYEKVSIEISNAGSDAVSGVELELWNNDELICTDKIEDTINPISETDYDGRYKHLFSKQVNCSKAGENNIVVKNVYSEDEGFCNKEKSLTVKVLGDNEYVESASSQEAGFFYLNNVKIGNIDNNSEASNYTDFSDLKTEIYKNKALNLSFSTDRECNVAVWVDWNNNGLFGDAGEFVGFSENTKIDTISISIPEGVNIKTGDKRMRIISVPFWETPTWSGSYNYGETEDYTLTVMVNPGMPSVSFNNEFIELNNNESEQILKIINNKDAELIANVSVNYILPGSPDGMNSTHSSEKAPENIQKSIRTCNIKHAVTQPLKDTHTQFILGYDRNPIDCITMMGDVAIFAQLYPKQMLKDIANMQISSVDAYIGSVPQKASVVIYKEKKNSNSIGDILLEKVFKPTANSWNRITLDAPFNISGNEGLIVAIKMSGFKEGEFYMGADAGDAVIGYGDLAGFNGYWWSMADLEVNSNYCIRANIIGEKTPAIKWLDVDKKDLNVTNSSKDIKISHNGTELTNYLYNAVLEFTTNDELRKTIKIPVYFLNDVNNSIISAKLDDAQIIYNDNEINIVSNKSMFNISVYDVMGNLIENIDPQDRTASISTINYNKGIYIVSIMYSNGNRQSIKIPVNI